MADKPFSVRVMSSYSCINVISEQEKRKDLSVKAGESNIVDEFLPTHLMGLDLNIVLFNFLDLMDLCFPTSLPRIAPKKRLIYANNNKSL